MENLVIDTAERVTTARLLTPAELGLCVRLFREMRQWSQEQLAEISGLNVRTIQRVEQGLEHIGFRIGHGCLGSERPRQQGAAG